MRNAHVIVCVQNVLCQWFSNFHGPWSPSKDSQHLWPPVCFILDISWRLCYAMSLWSYLVKASARAPQKTTPWSPRVALGPVWETLCYAKIVVSAPKNNCYSSSVLPMMTRKLVVIEREGFQKTPKHLYVVLCSFYSKYNSSCVKMKWCLWCNVFQYDRPCSLCVVLIERYAVLSEDCAQKLDAFCIWNCSRRSGFATCVLCVIVLEFLDDTLLVFLAIFRATNKVTFGTQVFPTLALYRGSLKNCYFAST